MAGLETRRLGRTGIRAKALGLGCASFGKREKTDRNAEIPDDVWRDFKAEFGVAPEGY